MRFIKPKFWDKKKLSMLSILLFPFTIIYLIALWISKVLISLKSYRKPPIPTICIGNIYIGGTGKTPLVREIFKITKSIGKNPAIIKKHYDYLDDEIEMLKDTGKTYTDKKRLKSIFQSFNDNHDVAILDDGFQDLSIKSNLSILCFNSKQNIGNGLLIPSGPLREGMGSISRADCVVINGDKDLNFEKKLKENFGNKKFDIFYSNYKIKNIEKFKNKEITAVAGIGNPSNFFDLLKENNLNVIDTYSFPDHHNYSEKDFEKIKKNKTSKIVTTEKDYYRMNKLQKENCEIVKVDLEIDNIYEFTKIIKSFL